MSSAHWARHTECSSHDHHSDGHGDGDDGDGDGVEDVDDDGDDGDAGDGDNDGDEDDCRMIHEIQSPQFGLYQHCCIHTNTNQ